MDSFSDLIADLDLVLVHLVGDSQDDPLAEKLQASNFTVVQPNQQQAPAPLPPCSSVPLDCTMVSPHGLTVSVCDGIVTSVALPGNASNPQGDVLAKYTMICVLLQPAAQPAAQPAVSDQIASTERLGGSSGQSSREPSPQPSVAQPSVALLTQSPTRSFQYNNNTDEQPPAKRICLDTAATAAAAGAAAGAADTPVRERPASAALALAPDTAPRADAPAPAAAQGSRPTPCQSEPVRSDSYIAHKTRTAFMDLSLMITTAAKVPPPGGPLAVDAYMDRVICSMRDSSVVCQWSLDKDNESQHWWEHHNDLFSAEAYLVGASLCGVCVFFPGDLTLSYQTASYSAPASASASAQPGLTSMSVETATECFHFCPVPEHLTLPSDTSDPQLVQFVHSTLLAVQAPAAV